MKYKISELVSRDLFARVDINDPRDTLAIRRMTENELREPLVSTFERILVSSTKSYLLDHLVDQ